MSDDIEPRRPFPNVHARLRITQNAPQLLRREDELEIWLAGSRFRVRDPAGREPNELLGELKAPRGLGLPAPTMEAVMDRRLAARRKPDGPTELYGDLESGAGSVHPPRGPPWSMRAERLAPIAAQILAHGAPLVGGAASSWLEPAGEVTRLGRTGTAYRGTVELIDDGQRVRNAIVRMLAPPYLLLDEIRDATGFDHFYIRELVALDEGAVTDADLTLR